MEEFLDRFYLKIRDVKYTRPDVPVQLYLCERACKYKIYMTFINETQNFCYSSWTEHVLTFQLTLLVNCWGHHTRIMYRAMHLLLVDVFRQSEGLLYHQISLLSHV